MAPNRCLACSAADFKRHVDDVEASLARKTEELHQYRHKVEMEMAGEAVAVFRLDVPKFRKSLRIRTNFYKL